MPILLPPISRRKFLSRSLAAVGGLALNSQSQTNNQKIDPQSWALLSDAHLAADRKLISRRVNMTDHFKSISEEVLGLKSLPVGIMITGDCAYNSGELGDYALLGELLNPLRQAGIPVHLALGNHDHRERFWEAFAEEKRATRPLADRQTALLKTANVNWFILDSLETTLSSPGLLGPDQLHWLAKALDDNSQVPALVVIHHNPGLDGGNLGLKDTFLLLNVIRPRKQVKAYIYGHTHSWKVETDTSGLHLINLPPTSYVFREGLPSGWVHARVENQGMHLELRCTDPTHEDHGQKIHLEWRVS
jgi:3',5'-cyclic AMP phosphodiesterase CpdA